MKSLKHYINLTSKAIKYAFIRLETMFVVINSNGEKVESKKIAEQAVKENLPICLTSVENGQDSLSLSPSNIFFPDTFLKKKDRVKKLYLELQNA